ncbi:bone morphogenetic protein 2-like [Amphiura filiformis]|uniref:bone morphogenetic protein 2-like n=1 Tax=Amphiura filiformis TaxID=82378 RepID=UPI003B21C914
MRATLFFSQLDDENPAASIRRERGSVDVFHTIDDHGSKELLDSRTVPLGVPIWRTFDVTDAVQLWTHEDVLSRKEIEIQSASLELLEALEVATDTFLSQINQKEENLELLPLENHLRLDGTFLPGEKQKPQRRSGRQARSSGTDCTRGETTCCREQRTVSFADLGWDYWVASPAHFTLYHCKGSCPQGHRMANNYASIRSQLHVINPSEWDSPCCTGSSLTNLSIQHLTATGYETAVMEDIIVEECMCV